MDGETLAQFETAGSCTYGGFTFSNFSYSYSSSGGGQTITPSNIDVFATSNADGYGLEFNASWNAYGNNSTSDGDIHFTVTANDGASEIQDAGLAVTDGVGGTGIATVSEQGCSGTSCIPGTWKVDTFDSSVPGTDQGSATTFITPTGSVTVSKDINSSANGVPVTDYATISSVVDTFSVVPEPRALPILLGLGLVAGLVVRKKFQSASA
ncbi:MAG: hypothetical protein ACLPWF_04325 [Bryobacteraceae bacterium]